LSLVGRQIGRYRILNELGQGGMSVVYKGLDTSLDRYVAVKVLHPHLAVKTESRLRLEREARAVARLKHANILEVYDFSPASSASSEESEAYIVTEYINGRTLRNFIETEQFTPPELAAMAMHEISQALAHAHESGVVHRDLKPDNIMLRDDGVLKVTDFGIAKIIDRDERMTMTGALVGSPAHMAPEIIEGEEAGTAADVFSLGTMLYLLATGQLPFTASNTTATLKKILDCDFVDPREVRPSVSDDLAKVISTCLSRDPTKRYPDARALQKALERLLEAQGIDRPSEELALFFASPQPFRQALVPRLVSKLLDRVATAQSEKRSARALSLLNQILALDEHNPKATALLRSIGQPSASRVSPKRLALISSAVGLLFIVTMAAIQGGRLKNPPVPTATELTDASSSDDERATPAKISIRVPEPVAAELGAAVESPVDTPQASKRSPKVTAAPKAAPMRDVDVRVQIRPYGYLTVDDGMVSADPLQMHHVTLPSGWHRFKVTCELCQPQGLERSVEIKPDMDNVTLVAPLLDATVAFAQFPDDALVQVGAEMKTVAESRRQPFVIKRPVEGSLSMQHVIRYQVSHVGVIVEGGTKEIRPGKLTTIEPKAGP
jgi:eukaryotic-like serine/threonine-protein kinase